MADKRINKILWHGNELDADGNAKAPAVATGADGLDGLNDGEVYICDADKDPAMFIKTDAGRVARLGGSGGDTYTKEQINQLLAGKVDTAFFSRLFGLMTDAGGEIAVNDVQTAAASIFAKLGLYTNSFLSALGLNDSTTGGGGSGGATTLGELANVGSWADEVPTSDRVMVQLAGATHWSSKPLSEFVGLDEAALAEYLAENKYATQSWVNTKLGSYATTSAMNSALGNKVDKVAGKGLSSNDFTDALLTKLNGIEEGANKYVLPTATGSVLGGVKVGATLAIASGVLNMKVVGTEGTYTKVTVDAYGRVTGHASLAATDIPNLPWSKITSGKPTTLAGYGITDAYTKQETDTKLSAKLDKATFEELFEKVELSDGTFAIHAKFGLYSDSFLSVLGMNPDGGSGGASSLSELSDVSLSGLQDGQALTWDAAAQKWVNKTLEAGLDEEALAEYLTDNQYAKKGDISIAGLTDLHSSWDALLKAQKPTTLAGYGIADAYTKSAADGRYVLKTGDTITGNLSVMQIIMQNSNEINSNVANGTLYLAYRGTTGGVNLCNNNAPLTYGSAKYAILHTGNYASTLDSRYVKKSGDTMTGVLTLPNDKYYGSNSEYAINLRNSDIINVNSIWTADVASAGEGIHFMRSNGNWDNLTASDGVLYFATNQGKTASTIGDKVWHAGNDGSGSGLDADLLDGYHSTSFSKRGSINVDAGTTVNVEDFAKNTALTHEAGTMFSVLGWAWTNSAYIKLNDSYTVDRMRYSILSYRNGDLNSTWQQQALMFLPTYGENKEIYLVQMNTNATAGVVTKYVKRYTDYDTILASNVASATKLATARTIWGQTFDGTGNVSGSMTGVININTSTDFGIYYNGNYFLLNQLSGGTFINDVKGTPLYLGYRGTSDLRFYAGGSAGKVGTYVGYWNTSGLTVNGNSTLSGNLAVSGGLTANGIITCNNNIVFNKVPIVNTEARYLYFGGDYAYGRIGWEDSTNFYIQGVSTGGTMHLCARNAGKLAVIDMQADSVNLSDNLTAQGTIYSKIGFSSDGYVSALGNNTSSDMRLKTKLSDIALTPKDIANAPAMLFAWKKNGMKDVGSSAQYWQGILPEAVKERGGWLEMEYGNIALVAAISIAKEVVSHEERIAQLEKENIGLKNKIKELERRV